LESILGVVVIAEDTAAHAPDHRTMPKHECCKSPFITMAEVVLEQFAIGQLRLVAQKHRPAKMPDDLAQLAVRDVVSHVRATLAFYCTITRTGQFDAFSWLWAGQPIQTLVPTPERGNQVFSAEAADTMAAAQEEMLVGPEFAREKQLESYRRMTDEERLAIALRLHELARDLSREGIPAIGP
jgi:hypothetical protein